MRRISPARAAFSVGLAIGLYHAAWAALVATGAAQPLLDYLLQLPFIEGAYTVAPFDADTAVMLIVLTYAIGAQFGLVSALIWNWIAGNPADRVRDQFRQRGGASDREYAN